MTHQAMHIKIATSVPVLTSTSVLWSTYSFHKLSWKHAVVKYGMWDFLGVCLPAVQQRGRSRAGPRACFFAREHLNLAVKDKGTSPEDKKEPNSSWENETWISKLWWQKLYYRESKRTKSRNSQQVCDRGQACVFADVETPCGQNVWL